MAGTTQALMLSLPPTRFRHCHFHFPSSTSFDGGRRCSLFSPIRIRASERHHHVDGNGNESVGAAVTKWLACAKPLLNFAANNFLPLALIGGVSLGLANPRLGCLAHRYHLSKFSTFAIFVISGLTLKNGDIGAAVKAWPVGVSGLLCPFRGVACVVYLILYTILLEDYFANSASTPTVCYRILEALICTVGTSITCIFVSFKLREGFLRFRKLYFGVVATCSLSIFVTGLALFCCMPTTLSSGVALTQLAGGNSALALAMTVISNLLGILIVPFSISKFVAAGVGVSVPTKQLVRSLVLTLLIPLILGKVFRESFKGLADLVDQNRKFLARISAICLSLVPWIQVSRSRSLLLIVEPAVFLTAIGLGALMHILLLVFNVVAVQGLSAFSGGGKSVFAKKENATAFVLVASQKTLPVLVAVVEQLGGAFGESGMLVLPCVAAHLNQIIMDSFLINFWLRKDHTSKTAKVA